MYVHFNKRIHQNKEFLSFLASKMSNICIYTTAVVKLVFFFLEAASSAAADSLVCDVDFG